MSGQAGGPSGVGVALRFIGAARRDTALRERLAARDGRDLAGVVEVAGGAGFAINADDLRAAFAVDWGLRRARYLREREPADRAATTVAVVQTPESPT